MARLYAKKTFEKPLVKLNVHLGRDLKEEREVLDYLAGMQSNRIPRFLTDMIITGFYYLVKRPQGGSKEPSTRARAMRVIEEIRKSDPNVTLEDLLKMAIHDLEQKGVPVLNLQGEVKRTAVSDDVSPSITQVSQQEIENNQVKEVIQTTENSTQKTESELSKTLPLDNLSDNDASLPSFLSEIGKMPSYLSGEEAEVSEQQETAKKIPSRSARGMF